MTALIVILIILAVFYLIGMIRLGGRLKYGEDTGIARASQET